MNIVDTSRRSSCSGSDISAIHAHQLGANSSSSTMIMLHELYEEMEPQITPSYRPHVPYEAPSKPSTAQQRLRAIVGKSKTKLKATHIMVQAVNEMQRKAVTKQKDTHAKGKPEKGIDLTSIKEVSQSLPNLTNGTKS